MAEFSNLKIEQTGNSAVSLGYIGSIKDVLAAQLPDALLSRTFLAEDYLYGFELASPRDKLSLGEALIVNDTCYTTSSDKTSSDFNRTIFGHEFLTGGMFIIPRGIKPTHKCTFQTDGTPIALMDFHKELYAAVKKPLAFAGIGELAELHGTAIGKPPLDGKAIFDHKDEYFPVPEIRINNVKVFIIGVLTDFGEKNLSSINRQLEVVLYKNPFDSVPGIDNHTHVITLKQSVKRVEDIRPDTVDRTLHLFADGTAVRFLQADIFAMSHLVDYQNRT
ncbi:MAG: hypothetical protein HQM10_12060 [Candidatus Riflebacteria bacterium]|nr:hypothetical protein [Candidatus Riflebacteria bacterium]